MNPPIAAPRQLPGDQATVEPSGDQATAAQRGPLSGHAAAPAPALAPAPAPNPGRVLAVLLLGPFMAQADATIANVATPAIHRGLGASGAVLELVIGGYLIAFAMLLITGARLGQTHGHRRLLMLGASVFTLASLLCGLAPDPVTLVLARILQGCGAALMFPQTLTGIQLAFTGAARTRAIGLYAVALSAGAVAGQILGGVLIDADLYGSHWRAIFLVNVPVGALLVGAARRHLPADTGQVARRLDLVGVATLSLAVLLLVLPLTLGRAAGWPLWAWLSLGAAVPAFAGFVALERRQAARGGAPLLNVAVLVRPAVGWSLITLAVCTGSYYALLFTLAQYLQQGLGASPVRSSLILVPWVAAFGLAGQLVRRLPARGMSAAPVTGTVLLAASYLAISAVLVTDRSGWPVLAVLLGSGGLGLGIQFSALIARLTTAVPAGYAPDISGVSTTVMQIGGAVGVAALGALYLAADAHPGIPMATRAFALTTAAMAGAALLASLAAARSARSAEATPRRQTPEGDTAPSGA